MRCSIVSVECRKSAPRTSHREAIGKFPIGYLQSYDFFGVKRGKEEKRNSVLHCPWPQIPQNFIPSIFFLWDVCSGNFWGVWQCNTEFLFSSIRLFPLSVANSNAIFNSFCWMSLRIPRVELETRCLQLYVVTSQRLCVKKTKRRKDEFCVTLPLAPNPSEFHPFHFFSVGGLLGEVLGVGRM